MARTLSIQLADLNQRIYSVIKDFNRVERKRILRKGARQVVLEARKTRAFKNRTGTLRKSLKTIPRLTKSLDVFVGPQSGANAKNDGYYAPMVFGSGAAFRSKVLEPAAVRAAPRALDAIEKESKAAIQRIAAKKNLR